jgi:hypothetical protein
MELIIEDSKAATKMSERLEQEGDLACEIVFPWFPKDRPASAHHRDRLALARRADGQR